jgi:fluoroquinolone resistance protein
MKLLSSETVFIGETFKHTILKSGSVLETSFNECKFVHCAFNETRFVECAFGDCDFEDCDLSLVDFSKSRFLATIFRKSKVVGIDWTKADWSSRNKSKLKNKTIDFYECVLNYSSFLGLDLEGIELSHCIARGASFEDANLSKANCAHTDFLESRFNRTNLTQADFTQALNYAIDVKANVLGKTKFSLPEAISLLDGLDIIIED